MVTPVVGDLEKFTFDTSMAAGLSSVSLWWNIMQQHYGDAWSALLVCCGGTRRSGSPGIFADRIEELCRWELSDQRWWSSNSTHDGTLPA
jgi:hypothetical protein